MPTAEAANASDDAVRTTKLAEHVPPRSAGTSTRSGRADHWAQFQPSPEFVVLLFALAISFSPVPFQADDRRRSTGRLQKKVLLATPATLIALPESRRRMAGAKDSRISTTPTKLPTWAASSYDRDFQLRRQSRQGRPRAGRPPARLTISAVGSFFEQTLLPGARKFSELGAKGAKELTEPAPTETTPRDVLKRA